MNGHKTRSELLEKAEKSGKRVELEHAHIAAVVAALDQERERGPVV